MASAGTGTDDSPSVDVLRRLKSAEGEWAAKIAEAKAATARRLTSARESADVQLKKARADADRLLEEALMRARATAEKEAELAVLEGRSLAAQIASAPGGDLGPKRDRVLDAVLGEFRRAAGK